MIKKLVIIMMLLCLVGCDKEKSIDVFKEEYEKYNEKYINIELENTEIVKYSNSDEVNKIIKDGTGIIFIGSPKDDLSRKAIEVLLSVSDSTNLEILYYIDKIEGINNLEELEGIKIPLVLFVLDGKIVSYHVGTINDKVDLSSEELVELYNIYMDGFHAVLGDSCDERC